MRLFGFSIVVFCEGSGGTTDELWSCLGIDFLKRSSTCHYHPNCDMKADMKVLECGARDESTHKTTLRRKSCAR